MIEAIHGFTLAQYASALNCRFLIVQKRQQ